MKSLKGISSMKLHRDIGVRQDTAWHMLHRIREGLVPNMSSFEGPVEVDQAYFGGKEANKHEWKKANLGRGPVGKSSVVGMKDRKTGKMAAKVVDNTSANTLQGFVYDNAEIGAAAYTDEAAAYKGMEGVEHETVKHSISEYVNGQAHTNGVENSSGRC